MSRPQTLTDLRNGLAQITGLPLGDIGIDPDPAHLAGGGYHCNKAQLQSISRWALGNEDYSVRQPRDRNGANDYYCAEDVGDDFPRGGRSAWLRWNNALQQGLQWGDPELEGLRAINFSPDGVRKCRYDSNNRAQGVIPSTDTVTWHTHLEFWRDTVAGPIGRRAVTRILQIAAAAVRNVPLSVVVAEAGGANMDWNDTKSFQRPDATSQDEAIVWGAAEGPASFGDVIRWMGFRSYVVYVQMKTALNQLGNLVHMANTLDVKVSALQAGQVPTPVLTAALKEALADPEVLALLKEAAFQGSQKAEQQ